MCILEPCGAAIKNAASLPAKEGTIFQVRNYVIKRILLSFVILFCVTFIIYVMMRSLPSSFAENMAMQLSQAPGAKPYQEWLDQLNAAYGLDKGILPGFVTCPAQCAVSSVTAGSGTSLLFKNSRKLLVCLLSWAASPLWCP